MCVCVRVSIKNINKKTEPKTKEQIKTSKLTSNHPPLPIFPQKPSNHPKKNNPTNEKSHLLRRLQGHD